MAFNKNKKIVTTALTAAMVASAVSPVAAAAAKLTPAQTASNAVKAYNNFKVTTKDEFKKSEALKKTAQSAVAKLTSKKDASTKKSLTTTINNKYKANSAVVANITKAETAVATYVNTKVVKVTDFAGSEKKKVAAQNAVKLLVNTGLKNTLNGKITAKYNELNTYYKNEVAAEANVEKGLKAIEAFQPTANTTQAEVDNLFKDAPTLLAAVKDPAKKDEFTKRGLALKSQIEQKIKDLKFKAETKVANVSAINSTDATVKVTFENAVDGAKLTGKKITLKGSQTLTATFVKVDGNVATFKVDQDILNKAAYNGDYTVSIDWATADAGLKTTYSAIVAGTFVEGFVVSGTPAVAVANATVTAGGNSVKTDAYGYYRIPVNAGEVSVKVENGADYFIKTAKADVQRNFSTVVNTAINKIVVSELAIDGHAVDAATGTNEAGVKADLQKKVNGKWVTISTATTDSTGSYSFGNTGSSLTDTADVTGPVQKLATDEITFNSELQVVLSKALSSTNLSDVYETKTVAVNLSKEQSHTAQLTELRPIKKIEEIKLGVKWNDPTGTDNDADFTTTTGLKAKLVGTDGVTEIVAEKTFATSNAVKASGEKELTNKISLVDATEKFFAEGGNAVIPTLPTGTYYLVLNDGVNAKTIVPVSVTEGQNLTVDGVIEKERTLKTTTKYGSFKYNESVATQSGTLKVNADSNASKPVAASSTEVTATVTAYKVVNGVDVKVDSVNDKFTIDATTKAIQLSKDLTKLPTGNYKIVVESDYIKGGKVEGTATVSDNAVSTKDLNVEAASTLTVDLKDEKGNSVATTALATADLLDENGNVISTQKDLAVTAGSIKLTGLVAGVQKVRVTLAGYETNTSDAIKVYDIQDQKGSLTLKSIKAPTLSGYVKTADDFVNVADGKATVMVYDEKGMPVTYYDVEGGNYSFTSGLVAGKTYTFVVRGEGIETATATVTVKAGANDPINFKVVKGAKGQSRYVATDSMFNVLDANKVKFTATDNKFASDYQGFKQYTTSSPTVLVAALGHDATGDGGSAVKAPNYYGTFDFTQQTDKKVWTTATALPTGDYKVLITEGNATPVVYKDFATTFTIKDINANFDGPAIQVQLVSGALTSTISGTVNADSVADYVVVFDNNGKIVAKTADIAAGTGTFSVAVQNNATYTVAYYANGKFVTSKVVTVQDYNVTGVTLTADTASR
ncbi:hypothetical protein [Gottfriedia luciferensis]|uniref:hypothetical protein n=1 Tax=Gottfriedia luciferensis TaxID=178774 RepID=UPI000B445A20|nr:hypothetical protein [Gottfriedia luciferensis]